MIDALSQERLAPYLRACGQDADAALELYAWNGRIGSALFELIQHVEVAVRNAIARALIQHVGTEDWPSRLPTLRRKNGRPVLHPFAVEDIDRAHQRVVQSGKAPTPGRITAELSFGFWRYLLAARYTDDLWIPALRHAFPAVRQRKVLEDEVNRLHQLRNRISHHEPVFARHLRRDANACLDILRWVSRDVEEWALKESRVPEVLREIPPAAFSEFVGHGGEKMTVARDGAVAIGHSGSHHAGLIRRGRLLALHVEEGDTVVAVVTEEHREGDVVEFLAEVLAWGAVR